MIKYHALPIVTKYWLPNESYLDIILGALSENVVENDFVVISEKALSTVKGTIVDESKINAGFTAKLISSLWMRKVWGRFLGVLCRFGPRLLCRLQEYSIETGSRHKQLVLQNAGFLQALMWGSEGGIDGSNLPYSYVSLPLDKPYELAEEIHRQIWLRFKRNVFVVIVDTDKTYSFSSFHFTPHPRPIKGIYSLGGIIAYVIGRIFKLKKRPTPLAVVGGKLQAEEALRIANIADRARGTGSGATVWDMAARFHVTVTGISWEMLSNLDHKPLVIVRRRNEVVPQNQEPLEKPLRNSKE